MTETRPAIFIDRDGTLSHEVGYVNHISRFRLYPWAVEAVKTINAAGYLAVVATNQAGVARGYFPESLVREVHAAALGSTGSTIALTTPRWGSRPTGRTATAASRARACCAARSPSSRSTWAVPGSWAIASAT